MPLRVLGADLRPAGKVVNFTRKGSLVLRAEKAPRIGDTVVDRRSNRIGSVYRITGPVKRPFLIVSNDIGDPEVLKTLPGRELYLSERKRDHPRRKGRSPGKGGYRRSDGKSRRPPRKESRKDRGRPLTRKGRRK